MSRRWLARAAAFVAAYALVYAVAAWGALEPQPLPLLLVCLLGAGIVWTVIDVLQDDSAEWTVPFEGVGRTEARDFRLAAHVRAIEGNLTARAPDGTLRQRVATLAEARLRTRHGCTLDSARGRELLGPDLADFLTGPPTRVSVTTLDRHLTRLEEL